MLALVIIIALFLGLIYSIENTNNKQTEDIWNNGVCKTCNQRFVPFGVNRGMKHYVCNGCWTEVTRY